MSPSPAELRRHIRAVYARATPAQCEAGFTWYGRQRRVLKQGAARCGVPWRRFAATVAVLSPGIRWTTNLKAAEKLAAGKPCAGYPRNVQLAMRILAGDRRARPAGPKVSAFYRLLRDGGNDTDICLDGHALNLALNHRRRLRGTHTSAALRADIEQAYRTVARQLGLPPHAVQATTWLVWTGREC